MATLPTRVGAVVQRLRRYGGTPFTTVPEQPDPEPDVPRNALRWRDNPLMWRDNFLLWDR